MYCDGGWKGNAVAAAVAGATQLVVAVNPSCWKIVFVFNHCIIIYIMHDKQGQ